MRRYVPAFAVFALALAVPSIEGQVTQQSSSSATTLQLSTASSAAKAEFWTGVEDWQNFAHASSQRHFERATSLDPSFGLARVFGAGAFSALGVPIPTAEMERGVADASRASTAEGVLALAWRVKTVDGEAASIQLLRFAMELMPDDPHLASEQVWNLAQKDVKAAVEFGRTARAKFPTFAAIAPALSYAFLRAGDTTSALAEAQRYTELAPAMSASFSTYGDLLTTLGRFDEAEAQYRKALAAPRRADYYADGSMGLATIMELRGNAAGARQVLADGLQHATTTYDSVGYLALLGGASLYAGDVRGAMSAYTTQLRLQTPLPNLGRFTGHLAMALANAVFGDGRLVDMFLMPVHALAPGDTAGIDIWFSDIYAYAGRSDSTLKYVDRRLARSPTDTVAARSAHFVLGQLYVTTGRCNDAVNEFRRSDSTFVEVQAGMAECELRLGHRAAAMVWRDRVRARRDVNFFDPGEIRARMRMAQMR